MNTSTAHSAATPIEPHPSPFAALYWKERREMRRQFWGAVIALVIIPVIFGIAYSILTGEEDGLIAGIMSLAFIAALPLAAGWGAHAVCRDLTTSKGAFLMAQPVLPPTVVLAKALAVVRTFLLLAIIDFGLIMVLALTLFTSSHILVKEILQAILGVAAGLIAVIATSFLFAVMIKRLIPAILTGLLAGVVLICIPTVLERFGLLSRWGVVAVLTLGMIAYSVLCFASACWIGWRLDRSKISNRRLAWAVVTLAMLLTYLISDSLATNTHLVATFGGPGQLLGAEDQYVFWMDSQMVQSTSNYAIHRIKLGLDGSVVEILTSTLASTVPKDRPDGWQTSLSDSRNLLVVRTYSKKNRVEIQEYSLDFEKPILQPRFAVGEDSATFGWVSCEDRLFCIGREISLNNALICYDVVDGQLKELSRLAIHAQQAELKIIDNSLWLARMQQDSHSTTYWISRVIYSPSSNDLTVSDSKPLTLAHKNNVFSYGQLNTLVIQNDCVAIAAPAGVGVYRYRDGAWTELGWRSANLIELLAGRDINVFEWNGDLLLERSGRRVVAYNTSSGRPRRVGQLEGSMGWDLGPVGSRHFVTSGQRGMEVHRLPD